MCLSREKGRLKSEASGSKRVLSLLISLTNLRIANGILMSLLLEQNSWIDSPRHWSTTLWKDFKLMKIGKESKLFSVMPVSQERESTNSWTLLDHNVSNKDTTPIPGIVSMEQMLI